LGENRQSTELSTWQQIGEYLGVSSRTAQIWQKERGLPIRKIGGRVVAIPAELDRWKREQMGAAGGPEREPDALETDSGLTDAPEIPPPPTSRRRWAWVYAVLCVAALATLLAGARYGTARWRESHWMSEAQVNGKNLSVLNVRGEELWRHTFDVALDSLTYEMAIQQRRVWIGDLYGDGRQELLLATFVPGSVGQEIGGRLICFGADGSILWEFVPSRTVRTVDQTAPPPYTTIGVEVLRGKTPAETRIALTSVHVLEEPTQVAVLDTHGRVLGEYWHAGHMYHMTQADLDGLGRNYLILGGISHGDHQATLVVLDPLQISGLSTPKEMLDHKFEILDMPAAKERAVVLFPRSCVSYGRPFTKVIHLHATRDRLAVSVLESNNDVTGVQVMYILDYRLKVVETKAPDPSSYQQAHEQLEASGALHHKFNGQEFDRLQASVIVR